MARLRLLIRITLRFGPRGRRCTPLHERGAWTFVAFAARRTRGRSLPFAIEGSGSTAHRSWRSKSAAPRASALLAGPNAIVPALLMMRAGHGRARSVRLDGHHPARRDEGRAPPPPRPRLTSARRPVRSGRCALYYTHDSPQRIPGEPEMVHVPTRGDAPPRLGRASDMYLSTARR